MENPKESMAKQSIPAPQGEIPRLLNELRETLEVSHVIADELSVRLSPTLRNEPSADDARPSEPADTDLGGSLSSMVDAARFLNKRLNDLINRSEL